jgi:hypothetical protein
VRNERRREWEMVNGGVGLSVAVIEACKRRTLSDDTATIGRQTGREIKNIESSSSLCIQMGCVSCAR